MSTLQEQPVANHADASDSTETPQTRDEQIAALLKNTEAGHEPMPTEALLQSFNAAPKARKKARKHFDAILNGRAFSELLNTYLPSVAEQFTLEEKESLYRCLVSNRPGAVPQFVDGTFTVNGFDGAAMMEAFTHSKLKNELIAADAELQDAVHTYVSLQSLEDTFRRRLDGSAYDKAPANVEPKGAGSWSDYTARRESNQSATPLLP